MRASDTLRREACLDRDVKLAESSFNASDVRVESKVASEQSEGVCRQLEQEGLKVGIAQIKALPTRLEDNYQKIAELIDRAVSEKLDLVVFPELTIPGYLALDYLNDPEFVLENVRILERLRQRSQGTDLTIVVGFVDLERESSDSKPRFFNSAAVLRNGVLVGVVDKSLLPDYDIFWENRYFATASKRELVEVNGHKIGLEICEDLWDKDYNVKVTDELARKGAELLINISASPFQVGKYHTRQELVSSAAKKTQLPFIYVNLVGAQDGYEGELVFDGRSMVCMPNGELAAVGKSFSEDLLIVDLKEPKAILLPDWSPVEEVYEALVLGIREYCARNGFKKVYIGLSGGIDSAVTAALAVQALGAENVIGITMPSHITSAETKSDALELAKNLGIRCEVRPIASMYQAWLGEAAKHHGEIAGIVKQNIQARLRGQVLMEYTNQDRGAMVVTTGNKTEMALGYMTLYGDMCGGLAALADVSKLMVYELASYHNRRQGREEIPATTITRTPSAELEEGQFDKDNLPADYPQLSPLVDALIDRTRSIDQLCERYGTNTVLRTLKLINQNEYKRRQAPPGIRVTSKAFGAGRRIPIDTQFVPARGETC